MPRSGVLWEPDGGKPHPINVKLRMDSLMADVVGAGSQATCTPSPCSQILRSNHCAKMGAAKR